MPISPLSRRRPASARRQLFAVLTAAFILFQQAVMLTPGASAQVRRAALDTSRTARVPAKSPAAKLPTRPRADAVTPAAPSTTVVISQVYGGGGNTGATYKNDFIELFNRGTSAQSLNGWSVQYTSATGTTWASTNLTNVTLQPGQYYLVQEAQGTGGTTNLPTPDATGTIAMSGTAGKVALVSSTTLLSGACPTTNIVDLVGFGSTANCSETSPAPAPSNTTADIRAANGCTDTDNNSTDFTAAAPNPRNTATALNACGGGSTPSLSINDVSQDEGNAGTTAFTFTVSISAASASNVTFNWSTADGTATAGSDYTAVTGGTGTITAGNTSTTVTVNVNGDTTNEPNETFFVNISNVVGANVGDGQGQGTIVNDDVTITPIYSIQGSGTTSPFANQAVTTTGIVTGLKNNGFFIQDPSGDGNTATSDGVFVFTSTAPPAAAVIGNLVRVSGTVQEFVPPSDPSQKPLTEIGGTPTTAVISTGNTLPAPVTVAAADTQVNNLENLERFEGMRVQVASLTVVAPTQGNINEPNATVTSTGVFYGVVTGVARPFREPGINASDPLPAGAPANVPRFDENPERLRVDSDAQPGTTAVNVSAGAVFTNVIGEMDYAFRTWTILPETTLAGGTNGGATPAPAPAANEFTVASFNMERFFDTTNDPSVSEPVLTTTAFNNRLNKASLVIRNVQRYPDVIGVQEMENLTTLQAVAAKVNSDAQTIDGLPDPQYTAYLVEGNDVGGIDVGFLVKASRVNVVDVTQVGKETTYTNPNTGAQETLNDRPPLVLRATIARPAGGTVAFTVIVNHLRSLSGIDDATPSGSGTEGARVRAKRRAQAEFLANYIQSRQTADPAEKIITVGDMNAFRVNDGYVDVIGTILGTPAPADQVVLASSDLVNPDQTDLVDTLPADQRYSFTFDGNAQVLDHVIVNPNALAILDRFAYARDDADQPLVDYADPNVPDRISDHDQPVAYFSLGTPQPQGSLVISEFRFRGPAGVTDEFVELYNNTASDITVSTTDGSAGWALAGSDGQVRFIIPNGTVVAARSHFLAANTGYSLCPDPNTNCYAEPDLLVLPDGVTTARAYTLDIPDGSGIALFRTSNPANFTATERLDAAGYSTAPALYREGAGLPTGGSEVGNDLEYSWLRHLCDFAAGVGCTTPGTPKDTGNNAADFISVDTMGTLQSLGAPGPESSSSAMMRNSSFNVTLLDSGRSASEPPNRDRDFNSVPPNNSSFGTMTIRRTVTNHTGAPVNYLGFRIIQITTWPQTSAQADLRALDSDDVTVTLSNGTQVPVRGTFVEQPPNQPMGGALNSSLSVGYINFDGNMLADGESINVQFVLGVQKTGTFRFLINIEALNAPPPAAPVSMQELKLRLLDSRPNGSRTSRPRRAR